MHRGHVKLFRKIRDHWIFKDPDEFRAWIIILMEVNHTPCKSKIGGRLIDCDRGESLYSLDTWASKFGNGWNKSKVNRFFRLLQSDEMIAIKSETHTTRLKVQNYSLYHDSCNADETKMKRPRNDDETMMKPIEECKEGKELKKEPKTTAPDGVTEKTWIDFLSLRKKKNAPVTDTVISGLKREGDKAGVTLEEVMQECCVQGWRGFKAEWYKKPAQQQKITPVPDNYPYKPFSQVDPRLPR